MPGGGNQPFIGQIIMVGFNFAPRGWALCNGQLMSIAENTTLFTLIGTTYGGDGVQTFGLPDLRSRVPVGTGQGVGLNAYALGASVGVETVPLTVNQLPQHQHVYSPAASQDEPTSNRPDNNYPALGGYYAGTTNSSAPMGTSTLTVAGSSQPHNNMQPFLGINFVISLFGIFPSQ
jgi:microcystin-dependent protein